MYENPRMQPGAPRPLTQSQPNPFEGAFYGAGSGLIRGDLGTYGEKFLGSSSEYVQSNISRYFSDPQYYFQVNDQYVRNKLKVVLFPFLHRVSADFVGQLSLVTLVCSFINLLVYSFLQCHWTRITEPVGGRLSYRPPIYDINAPDLYIPFMAFGTYVILAGLLLGLQGRFSPDAVQWLFVKGLLGWSLQVMLLKVTLLSLGGVEPPLLDIVAYAGYTFAGLCLAIMGKIILSYMYFVMMPLACLCMGIFLVKTMKRVLSAEVRSYDSSRLHYLLLFIAFAQFPLFSWLGNISLNWLF
ncbi:protein YIF1B isoform X2 [Rhodamnia argentea]|uniref:Protein YIF1B isoform X1 n=1 Tax=Rhodamnia argentea TaxID=178133 RepID=A0A8B8NZ44_9MYRT|nr:protein YIF1B isoform X1 [Rhodamnia argentea]XP_048127522.1 protein YIF1B isoform X1 [Rhodamnia argentea]XP_048127523.1 protein YIF1B isoform X2 [Rhodamnia argentea]